MRRHLNAIAIAAAFVGVVLLASSGSFRAWALEASLPAAGKEFKDCDGCPAMVVIPPGKFTMGSPEGWTDLGGKKYGQPDELPAHAVNIAYKFAAGKYEVTVAEYRKFAEETKRVNSDTCIAHNGVDDKGLAKLEVMKGHDWRNPGYTQTDDDPVVCIAWNDAKDYANWLSAKTGKKYRLLTEAEFEYAAKGGTDTLWYWGNDPNQSCQYGNLADLSSKKEYPGFVGIPQCDDGYPDISPVGKFKPNKFGLYDMVGNAEEWNEDCATNDYKGAPTDGSAWMNGADCDYRIYRSGTYGCTLTCNPGSIQPAQVNNVQPGAVGRAANRDRKIYSYRSVHNGIRVARVD